MVHQPDYLEIYKEIFESFMRTHTKAIHQELHTIYKESIATYVSLIKTRLDSAPIDSGMRVKILKALRESEENCTLPGFLMTEEFYMIKALHIYKSLDKYYDKVYDFCIDKLENVFYIHDDVAAGKFTSSVIDYIQDNMWVDAIPSILELESRKN